MRTFILAFILTIATNFISCSFRPPYSTTMQQAESIMNTRPDSALKMLQGMADSIHVYPEETQMYWHLLTIQARDKLYITHTSDSLINRIVEFYENREDKAKRMMAYYYQGRVYRDMNDAPRALKAFQRAEELQVHNRDLLTKVYSQMGYLYAYQGFYDEAIVVNRKAMFFYEQSGKKSKASYALRDIARMYNTKGMRDSASYYYEQACRTALADKDSTRYYGMLGELANCYYSWGKADTAKTLLLKVWNCNVRMNKTHVFPYLGHIYEQEQRWDSATFYYNKSLDDRDLYRQMSALKGLGRIEKQANGNCKKGIEYMERALRLNDSILRRTQTEAIAKVHSLYNYQNAEAENARLSLKLSNLQNRTFLVGVFVLVVVCAVYVLQHWNNQKKLWREQRLNWLEQQKYTDSLACLKENESRIMELNKLLDEERKNSSLKQKLLEESKRELEMHNQEIIARRKVIELKVLSLENSDIYQKFHGTLSGDVKIESEDWEVLRAVVDETYPGFTSKMQMLYPKISLVELQVCWLTKIAVPATRIAMLTSRSCSAVSNIRARLYRKIFDKEGTAGKFCEFIEEL